MMNILKHALCLTLAVAVLPAALVSCTPDDGGAVGQTGTAAVISAGIEPALENDGTRVKLDGNNNIVWEADDAISIVGSSSAKFTLSGGAGTSYGSFTGNIDDAGSAPRFAVLPADSKVTASASGVTFSIPRKKNAQANNIARSVVPMAGQLEGREVRFHNLFGLLKMTFTSPKSVNIKKISLHDLGGNMLWGDCFIPVKADTLAYSDFVLSGGDNTVNMVWDGYATMNATAKSYYFPIPPGALDRGFSLVLYEYDADAPDGIGRAYTFIQKVTDPVAAVRSVVLSINPVTLTEKSEPLDVKARGYYKTLFVNAGPKLSNYYSTSDFKWLTTLGIAGDYEYFAGDSTSAVISRQASVINKSSGDANGVLLYPDGEPRFRLVYSNGGKSTYHAYTLYQDGRRRYHDFFHNGGSYVGSCAGGFLARSIYNDKNCYDNPDTTLNRSFGIWPGTLSSSAMPINNTDYPTIYTAQKMLCSFGPFSAGDTIEQVKHHGGFYVADNAINNAIDHETLMSYQYTTKNTSNQYSYTEYNRLNQPAFGYGSSAGPRASRVNTVSMIAYKASEASGRAILCGSHPEREVTGKKLKLMETMVEYALAGTGDPDVKGELQFGEPRVMDKRTTDACPEFTKIGDRQYHHFTFVNDTRQDVIVSLKSSYNESSGIDLYLALRKDGFAWMSDADYVICSKGGNKTLDIKSLPAGKWYVSVYCATTVTSTSRTGSNNLAYFTYSGKTQVLDGVAYTIYAGVEAGITGSLSLPEFSKGFSLGTDL